MPETSASDNFRSSSMIRILGLASDITICSISIISHHFDADKRSAANVRNMSGLRKPMWWFTQGSSIELRGLHGKQNVPTRTRSWFAARAGTGCNHRIDDPSHGRADHFAYRLYAE